MLTTEQIAQLRKELQSAKNPLFIYDNDADGLCAFLLLYRYCKEGKGIVLHSRTKSLNIEYVRKVEEFDPDKIFVLDIPDIDQEFIDKAKRPIFWIDHHQPVKRNNVQYFNPLVNSPNSYIPTSWMAYNVVQQDIWLATVGTLADYALPDFIDTFIEQYPKYLFAKEDLPTTLYKRPIGTMVKLIWFLLKGPSGDVHKSIKILQRITSPDEIIKEQSSQGKFLHKRFKKLNERYMILLNGARKQATSSPLLVYIYSENQWSFTANVANELMALYPKKVIIIARNKDHEFKCSIRAQYPIKDSLELSFTGLRARGGGHPNACGAVIHEDDWKQFLRNFKEAIKKKR